jgi:hypothetical protein
LWFHQDSHPEDGKTKPLFREPQFPRRFALKKAQDLLIIHSEGKVQDPGPGAVRIPRGAGAGKDV